MTTFHFDSLQPTFPDCGGKQWTFSVYEGEWHYLDSDGILPTRSAGKAEHAPANKPLQFSTGTTFPHSH